MRRTLSASAEKASTPFRSALHETGGAPEPPPGHRSN
jgi:hypothetical protein